MNVLRLLLCVISGISAGILTSAGFFTVITSVGVCNRIATVTQTTERMKLYESAVTLGATVGNIVWIFELPVHLSFAGIILFGLISGIFIGIFAVSLAENLKALPIMVRRIRIGYGLAAIVIAIALGKGVGQLLYYLKMYK